MSAMIGYRESGGTKEGFSILRGGFLVMEMERSKQPSLPIGPGGPGKKHKIISGKIQVLGLVGPSYYFCILHLEKSF